MLFQTTRIRVDVASHGTCCELYFSAKQRDFNGNGSTKNSYDKILHEFPPLDV